MDLVNPVCYMATNTMYIEMTTTYCQMVSLQVALPTNDDICDWLSFILEHAPSHFIWGIFSFLRIVEINIELLSSCALARNLAVASLSSDQFKIMAALWFRFIGYFGYCPNLEFIEFYVRLTRVDSFEI